MSSRGLSSSGRLPSIQWVYKILPQIESESSTESEGVLTDIVEAAKANNSNNAGTIKYWISMAPFERFLLQSVADSWNLSTYSFGETEDDEALLEYLFSQWDWSYDTQAFLCEAFYNTDARKNKTLEEIYNDTLHILGRLPSIHLKREYRVEILRNDNQEFLSNLGDRDFSNVKFLPSINDSYYWKILVAMYRDSPDEMEFWTNAVTRRKIYGTTLSNWKTWVLQYDIWKLVRMFDLLKRRPENALNIINLFTVSENASLFQASLRLPISMVEDESESNRELEDERSVTSEESGLPTSEILSNDGLIVSNDIDNDNDVSESTETFDVDGPLDLPTTSKDEESTHVESQLGQSETHLDMDAKFWLMNIVGGQQWAYARCLATMFPENDPPGPLSQALNSSSRCRRHIGSTLRFEPGSYLELIPWHELTPIQTPKHVPAHFPSDFLINDERAGYPQWVAWEAGKVAGGRILRHHLVPEEEVYGHYLTKNWTSAGYSTQEGEIVFTLIPLEQSMFLSDVNTYWSFWNDVALTIGPENTCFLLQTVPGMIFRKIFLTMDQLNALRWFRKEVDAHVNLGSQQSKHLREVLGGNYQPRYEGLLHFIPFEEFTSFEEKPLGHGKYGAVLAATWRRPPSMEHKQATEIPVVLKRVLPSLEMSEPEKLKKFFHELDLTYSALAGSGGGCVAFYGITKVSKIEGQDPSKYDDGFLCLVFERASKGNLMEFLEQYDKKDDWSFILETLKAVGGGLNQLHRRGIAHRDLHPGNILITKTENSEEDVKEGWSEYKTLLCDLGEGKLIGNQISTGGNLYSPKRYRAPEVNEGKPYTMKSDIYSFGVIAGELLKTAAEGKSPMVPIKLLDVYERCTRENPDERPERILDIVFELERLHDDEMLQGKMEFGDFFQFEEKLRDRWKVSKSEQEVGSESTTSYVKPQSTWTT